MNLYYVSHEQSLCKFCINECFGLKASFEIYLYHANFICVLNVHK